MTAYSFSQLIDFTRTSSGTFVGSNGLIQTTPQSRNLLTFTQEFDNAFWAKLNASVTANTTAAPDGTMTADTLSDGTATDNHGVRPTSPALTNSTTYTLSVYAKASTRRYIILDLVATSSTTTYSAVSFDLQTGVVVSSAANGTGYAVVSSSIQNVGNGWYRCIATLTIGSVGTVLQAYIGTSLTGVIGNFGLDSYTGTNGTVFLWGAQLEQASTATDYTRNVGGLFPPRFDYDPVTLAPRGILIEEQRTNLLLWSEQFDNAAWVKFGSGTGFAPVVTANAAISPDGTLNADLIVFNRGAGNTLSDQSRISQGPTVVNATAYNHSVYIKAATAGDVGKQIGFRGVAGSAYQIFTLTSSWVRISINETSSSTTGNFDLATRGTITADNTVSIHIWGAQLEAGAFATSYIPTVASQVTRTADQASIVAPMFAPWYNESAGTFVIEGTSPNVFGPGFIGAGAGTGSVYRNATGGADWWNGAAVMSTANNVANWAIPVKISAAYDSGNRGLCLAGGAVATSATTLPNGGKLELGRAYNGANPLNGHIRRVTYYPTRLSDLQLQALTA
jgi:hypothetical protein